MAAVDGDQSIGDQQAFVAVVLVASVTVAEVHQRLKDARTYPQLALAVVVGEHVASSHDSIIVRLEQTEAGRVEFGHRLLNARKSEKHFAGAH